MSNKTGKPCPCGLTRNELRHFHWVDKDQRCTAKLANGEVCGRYYSEHPEEASLSSTHNKKHTSSVGQLQDLPLRDQPFDGGVAKKDCSRSVPTSPRTPGTPSSPRSPKKSRNSQHDDKFSFSISSFLHTLHPKQDHTRRNGS